jgi:hypothetical protein
MDSSTSAPPDPSHPVPPEARQETLTTIAAQVAAIDTVIDLARLSIRVFDVDLSDMGWNHSARADRIATFLRSRRGARLDIVLHDTSWAQKSCPQLTSLLRHYSHAITIYRAGEEGRRAMDPMVIVDSRHFVHRFHAGQPRASFAIEQPKVAGPLVERFEEIWSSAEPGINATVLGL